MFFPRKMSYTFEPSGRSEPSGRIMAKETHRPSSEIVPPERPRTWAARMALSSKTMRTARAGVRKQWALPNRLRSYPAQKNCPECGKEIYSQGIGVLTRPDETSLACVQKSQTAVISGTA